MAIQICAEFSLLPSPIPFLSQKAVRDFSMSIIMVLRNGSVWCWQTELGSEQKCVEVFALTVCLNPIFFAHHCSVIHWFTSESWCNNKKFQREMISTMAVTPTLEGFCIIYHKGNSSFKEENAMQLNIYQCSWPSLAWCKPLTWGPWSCQRENSLWSAHWLASHHSTAKAYIGIGPCRWSWDLHALGEMVSHNSSW